jgi:hypothetical protein
MNNPIPDTLRALIIGTWIGGLVWFERRHVLRSVQRSKLRRDIRNLVIAGPAGAVMQVLEMPVALGLAELTQKKTWGLLPQLHLPRVAAAIAGCPAAGLHPLLVALPDTSSSAALAVSSGTPYRSRNGRHYRSALSFR